MELTELREIPNDVPASTPAPDLSSLSDAQLIEQMKIQEQAISEKQKADTVIVADPQTAPVAPVPTGQAQSVQQPAPVTQVPQPTPTAQELAEKKGFKSIDDLAKSYINLEKALTKQRQEEARASRGPIDNPIPAMPQDNIQNLNEVALQALNNDPIGTIGAIAEQRVLAKINAMQGTLKSQELHSAVSRLSSEPATQDFNSPEMQAEILKIYQDRPEWAADTAKHLDDAYYIAKGRMSSRMSLNAFQAGKENGQQTAQMKQLASVETTGKPPVINKATNIYDAPVDELGATIKALLAKGG